jgi:hypothetical protein
MSTYDLHRREESNVISAGAEGQVKTTVRIVPHKANLMKSKLATRGKS